MSHLLISLAVSRSPKVGLPILGKLGVRMSDSQHQKNWESECHMIRE